jgi:hypothetical protein
MPHNTIGRNQEDLESRLWIASRNYITGKTDSNNLLKEIEKDYTAAFNHAMIIISKRNLSYNFLTKLRKLLKLKSRHGNTVPLGHPYVQ